MRWALAIRTFRRAQPCNIGRRPYPFLMTQGTPDRVIAPKGDAPAVACLFSVAPNLMQDEILMVAFVAAGYTDGEIAEELGERIGQVRWAVRNALAKLGARNRPHAVSRAVALGYLELRTR